MSIKSKNNFSFVGWSENQNGVLQATFTASAVEQLVLSEQSLRSYVDGEKTYGITVTDGLSKELAQKALNSIPTLTT